MIRTALVALLATLTFSAAFAQDITQDITGVWEGTLTRRNTPQSAPKEIRVVVNLSRNKKGELTGMMFGTEHGAAAFPIISIAFENSVLSFTVSETGAGTFPFTGTAASDGNTIDGFYHSQPLYLKRTHPLTAADPAPTAIAAPKVPPSAPSTTASIELLKTAQDKIFAMTKSLTKYTCLESIDRTYYVPPPTKAGRDVMTAPPASCANAPASTRGLQREASDRLRLQVGVATGTEIHSWPNSPAFDSRTVFQMVQTGPISTGSFGLYLIDIFENPGTQFFFIDRMAIRDREVFRYRFRVPFEASHNQVRGGDAWITTAYSGTFYIYAATGELARLSFLTDDLSPATQMCRARTTIDYHMVLIGDGELMLPLRSELDTYRPDHDLAEAVTTFSACREYRAESSIHFDETADEVVAAKTVAPVKLPSGIPVTLALTDPIEHSAAAGDLIAARFVHAVHDSQSNRVLIPAGAIARGRITLMERRFPPTPVFEISMTFDSVLINGAASPLSLRVDHSKEKLVNEKGLKAKRQEFSLPAEAEESQITVVFVSTGALHAIPAKWESKWITR